MTKGDLWSQGGVRDQEDVDLSAGTNRRAELRLRLTQARGCFVGFVCTQGIFEREGCAWISVVPLPDLSNG
jgi:hypothetical protein